MPFCIRVKTPLLKNQMKIVQPNSRRAPPPLSFRRFLWVVRRSNLRLRLHAFSSCLTPPQPRKYTYQQETARASISSNRHGHSQAFQRQRRRNRRVTAAKVSHPSAAVIFRRICCSHQREGQKDADQNL